MASDIWSGLGRLLPMFSAELAFLLLLKIWSTWFRMNSITNCCTRTSRKAASPLQPTASISFDLHERRGILVASIATHSPWQGKTSFLPARLQTGMLPPLLLHLLLSFPHRLSSFLYLVSVFITIFPVFSAHLLFSFLAVLFSLHSFWFLLMQQRKL